MYSRNSLRKASVHLEPADLNTRQKATRLKQSMAVFGSYLYVGTHNTTGCQVLRSSNSTTWEVSNAGAFGDLDNKSVSSLAVFGGWLYAGTENSTDGLGVYRIHRQEPHSPPRHPGWGP